MSKSGRKTFDVLVMFKRAGVKSWRKKTYVIHGNYNEHQVRRRVLDDHLKLGYQVKSIQVAEDTNCPY